MATKSPRSHPSTITDLTGALEIRKRGAFRRRLRIIAIIASIGLVVIGLGYLIWFSPALVAKQVKVKGASLVSPEQVIETARVPLGVPLARVDVSSVADRVLKLGPVKEVEISRAWPTSITIKVSERIRVYQREENGSYQWVDSDGVVFYSTTESSENTVVHTATTDRRLLKDVAVVMQAIPGELRPRVHEIVASSTDRIIVRLDRGQQVFWGSADRSEVKAQLLPKLLAIPGTVFDISSPGHPTVR